MTSQPRHQEVEAENWDEDFLFQSTADDDHRPPASPLDTHAEDQFRRWSTATDSVAWDEEAGDEDEDSPQRLRARLEKAKPVVQAEDVHWGDSDDDEDEDADVRTPNKQTRPQSSGSKYREELHSPDAQDDEDDDPDYAPAFGLYDMDKTITLTRQVDTTPQPPKLPPSPRTVPLQQSNNSSSASLPSSSIDHLPLNQYRNIRNQHPSHARYYSPSASPTPLPYSPSVSGFSIGQSSSAPSTAPLVPGAVRSTGTSSLHELQSVPPSTSFQPPRHRRRLRKKSRPPQMDMFEMVETRLQDLDQQGFQEELEDMEEAAVLSHRLAGVSHPVGSLAQPSARSNLSQTMPMALTSMPNLGVEPRMEATEHGLAQDISMSSDPSFHSGSLIKIPGVPLLSRIGSMKRWSVRRTSGSTQQNHSLSQNHSTSSLSMSQDHLASDTSYASAPGDTSRASPHHPQQALEPHTLEPAATSPRSWIFRSVSNSASLSSHSPTSSPEVKRRPSRLSFLNDHTSKSPASSLGKEAGAQSLRRSQPPSSKKQTLAKVFGFGSGPSTSSAKPISAVLPADNDSTPVKRPVSLQPQMRVKETSTLGRSTSSRTRFVGSSVGRSVSNPYIDSYAANDENSTNLPIRPGLMPLRGLSSSSSHSSKHRRNKSLGADYATSGGALGLVQDPDQVPVVPPLPAGVSGPPVASRPPSRSRSRAGSVAGSIRPASRAGSIRSSHRRDSICEDSVPPSRSHSPRPLLPTQPQSQKPPPSAFMSSSSSLLPPIELSPPSPPRVSTTHASSLSHPPISTVLQLTGSPPSTSSPGQSSVLTPASTLPSSPPRAGLASSLGRTNGSLVAGLTASTTQHLGPQGPLGLNGTPLRRNSLGDLKMTAIAEVSGGLRIPDRISRAQVGLRNNMGMVKEFAGNVEQLKKLQLTYQRLLIGVEQALDEGRIIQEATSAIEQGAHGTSVPSDNASKPPRISTLLSDPLERDKTTEALKRLDEQYALWWECADLLIELGGPGGPAESEPKEDRNVLTVQNLAVVGPDKSPTDTITPLVSDVELLPPSQVGSPTSRRQCVSGVGPSSPILSSSKNRERAITLAGSESVSTVAAAAVSVLGQGGSKKGRPSTSGAEATPTETTGPSSGVPSQWRASTGRQDLNHRQLSLLKEMLATPDPASLFSSSSSSASTLAMKRYATEPGIHGPNSAPLPSSSGMSMPHRSVSDTGAPSSNIPPIPQTPTDEMGQFSMGGEQQSRVAYRAAASAITLPSSSSTSLSVTSSPSPNMRISALPPIGAPYMTSFGAASSSLAELGRTLSPPAHEVGIASHGNLSATELAGGSRVVVVENEEHRRVHDAEDDPTVGRRFVSPSTSDHQANATVSNVDLSLPSAAPPKEGKLRRASRVGLTGIRDILKSLKKTTLEERERMRLQMAAMAAGQQRPVTPSNTAVPVERRYRAHRSTSAGPGPSLGTRDHASSSHHPQPHMPINQPVTAAVRKSPRRPSLASIFRLGGHSSSNQKGKSKMGPGGNSSAADTSATEEDEYSDWDRMDSASDLDVPGRSKSGGEKNATLKGRRKTANARVRVPSMVPLPSSPPSAVPMALHPYRTRAGSGAASSASLVGPIAEEMPVVVGGSRKGRSRPGSAVPAMNVGVGPPPSAFTAMKARGMGPYPYTGGGGIGSMEDLGLVPRRSMERDRERERAASPPPPPQLSSSVSMPGEIKLALTPDNIKPLLEYAREVTTRLNECVGELRELASASGVEVAVQE